MQISVDTPLTDQSSTTSPPQQPYNANPTITVPNDRCSHIVYVRLFQNGSPGAVFQSKAIVVDANTVNASVRAVNPHLRGLPAVYTQIGISGDPGGPGQGASDGDPTFTRDRTFFLGISDAGDCTGLASFVVSGGVNETIPAGGVAKAVALPGNSDPGSKPVNITVSDKIGNAVTFGPFPLTYDPIAPVYNGGSFTGDSNNNRIIRTLTFSGVDISDNLYDQDSNDADDFWGVWLANANLTATPTITSGSPSLDWSPVRVATPGASFSLPWSLFSGLDYSLDGTHAGTYRVFARFLDGAGNPTDRVISTTLTLSAPYSLPKNYLPMLRKSQ